MVKSAPLLDRRNATEIANQVRQRLKENIPSWQEALDSNGNPVGNSAALISVFARFCEIIIERLNRVPDKNFLAFLNLLGALRLPPQPARVPLTFFLTASSTSDAIVPAGTQVAAPPATGEKEPLVFETERELAVTTAQLTAIFLREPAADRYSDYTLLATALEPQSCAAFQGNQPIDHSLYLACDVLLSLPLPKTVKLTIQSLQARQLAALPLTWFSGQGGAWQPLLSASVTTASLSDSQWEVSLANLSVPERRESPTRLRRSLNGVVASWLRLQLNQPIASPSSPLPTIGSISASVDVTRSNWQPDSGFANSQPLDLTKDFYPLGQAPRLGDAWYLASKEAFALAGAIVTIAIALSDAAPINASSDLTLAWEAWDGQAWQPLNVPTSPAAQLRQSGSVTFTLPSAMGLKEVNGQSNYWLRVRLVRGNYGTEATASQSRTFTSLRTAAASGQTVLSVGSVRGFLPNDSVQIAPGSSLQESREIQTVDIANNNLTLKATLTNTQPVGTGVWLVASNALSPPLVKSLNLSYQASKPVSALSQNDFIFDLPNQDTGAIVPFRQTSLDVSPSLYLGFDRPFQPNQTITLYVQVEPSPTPPTSQAVPRLRWEYYGQSTGWTQLLVQDETAAFTKSGLIAFISPADGKRSQQFGQERYWLRVIWQEGSFPAPPKLQRLLINTTWASQAVTIEDEVLGTSNGIASQQFRTLQAPVLLGQQLIVRELEELSKVEKSRLLAEEGEDAIFRKLDGAGRTSEIWVRWHEVADFYASGPRDRHYTLNHLTGEITFGNGINGLIPPPAPGNLRMVRYRTGGGAAGNCSPQTVVQLKTTVPYIDRATNYEAATGGADAEPLEELQERTAHTIRHGDRAVTGEDCEDLALLASTAVARVKCVPLLNLRLDPYARQNPSDQPPVNPGAVSIIVVPDSTALQPVPSGELLQQVQTYLEARAIGTASIYTVPPLYLKISIAAEIALTSPESASQIERSIHQELKDFLHPLRGGFDGKGWPFGREPWQGDRQA